MTSRGFWIFASAVAISTAFGVWLVLRPGPTVTRLTFLSVGQGDCALFQTEDGAILIDTGPNASTAELTVLPTLRELGVTRLDAILISHPDRDHTGGAKVILQRYPGTRLEISAAFQKHPEITADLADWRVGGSQVDWLPLRTEGTIGSFDIESYCPPAMNDNDASMIVRLKQGGASATFSGDASAEGEAIAAASGDWRAQIMKAGHHGSKTSTSYGWLREVHPETVVISCGTGNRYGHPHAETLKRLSSAGATVMRTDQQGTLRFVVRDGKFVPEQ